MMAGSVPEVCVLADFAVEVARRFANWATGALARRQVVHVALAGGTTPKAVHDVLARKPYRDSIPWASIHFYQGDERPVPVAHPESNWGMACASLLDVVGVPDANRHPMRGDAPDLEQAANAYASDHLAQLDSRDGRPVLDLILLGMGPDGHTASLFPGTAGLNDAEHAVVANHVPQIGQTRLTLTLPTINAAREVWFLVAGESKAEVTARVLQGRDANLPAFHVQPVRGRCLWLLDSAAARRIQ